MQAAPLLTQREPGNAPISPARHSGHTLRCALAHPYHKRCTRAPTTTTRLSLQDSRTGAVCAESADPTATDGGGYGGGGAAQHRQLCWCPGVDGAEALVSTGVAAGGLRVVCTWDARAMDAPVHT
jgi:hypothetical protein